MPAIGLVTVVVADYEEAIDWYTRMLGFRLVEDTPLGAGKRWLVVAPEPGMGTRLLLALPGHDDIAQAELYSATADQVRLAVAAFDAVMRLHQARTA